MICLVLTTQDQGGYYHFTEEELRFSDLSSQPVSDGVELKKCKNLTPHVWISFEASIISTEKYKVLNIQNPPDWNTDSSGYRTILGIWTPTEKTWTNQDRKKLTKSYQGRSQIFYCFSSMYPEESLRLQGKTWRVLFIRSSRGFKRQLTSTTVLLQG